MVHMSRLLIVGGQQRRLRSLLRGARDWYEYQKGLIVEVDPATTTLRTHVEYVSPAEAIGGDEPIILFKSATHADDRLYTCTPTEVIVYRLPTFTVETYITLPCFNDLHHVRPTPHGTLLVANTGLDMVLELTLHGEVIREWSVLGEAPWARFDRTIDYRKGISTKPHHSHPNYLFYLGDEPWATRFHQRDAISLRDATRRIAIDVERVHDGVVHGEWIYFTTVDGHVAIAGVHSLQVEELIDLSRFHDESLIAGWCRSLMVDRTTLWVGFSRLRPTRFRDNVAWVKNRFRQSMPTHVACYDLVQRRRIAVVNVEQHGLNAIFSIHPITDQRPDA